MAPTTNDVDGSDIELEEEGGVLKKRVRIWDYFVPGKGLVMDAEELNASKPSNAASPTSGPNGNPNSGTGSGSGNFGSGGRGAVASAAGSKIASNPFASEIDDSQHGVDSHWVPDVGVGEKKSAKTQNQQHHQHSLRFVIVVLDNSLSPAQNNDVWKPSNMHGLVDSTQKFIHGFFRDNPISHLGIHALRDGKSDVVCEPSGGGMLVSGNTSSSSGGGNTSSRKSGNHAALLEDYITRNPPSGHASVVNGISRAADVLAQSAPSHATREILLLFSSLNTHDVAHKSAREEVREKLIASNSSLTVLSVTAEIRILRSIVAGTEDEPALGDYRIALDGPHFQQLLGRCLRPMSVTPNKTYLVKMCFPRLLVNTPHANQESDPNSMEIEGDSGNPSFVRSDTDHHLGHEILYECPQCFARTHQMPGKCKVCGVYLVSSAALAQTTSRSGSGMAAVRHGLPKKRKKQEGVTQPAAKAAKPAASAPPSPSYQPACYGCAVPLAAVWLDRKRGYVTEGIGVDSISDKGLGGDSNGNKTQTTSRQSGSPGGSAGQEGTRNSPAKSPQVRSPKAAESATGGTPSSSTKLVPATSSNIQAGVAFPYHCSACKHAFCAICVEFAWKVLCHCPGCD